jgi:hypothetical protein
MIEPEKMTEEQKLLAMLQELGLGPEGLASMAFGGPVQYKANGFGITNVLDPEALKRMEEIKAMIAQMSGRPPKQDLVQIRVLILNQEPIKPKSLEDIMENQIVNNDTTRTEILAANDPDYIQDIGDQQCLTRRSRLLRVKTLRCLMQELVQLLKYWVRFINDPPEQKGSMVRTQTLPGNS